MIFLPEEEREYPSFYPGTVRIGSMEIPIDLESVGTFSLPNPIADHLSTWRTMARQLNAVDPLAYLASTLTAIVQALAAQLLDIIRHACMIAVSTLRVLGSDLTCTSTLSR